MMPKKVKKVKEESVKESEKEPEKINPRWDKINMLYDAVDESIVTLGNEHEMNFVEISMAMHMIFKKLEYEQFRAMFDFNMSVERDEDGKERKMPDSMYR
jgi:hypothetical protein